MLELPPVLVPGMTLVYTCALRVAGPSSKAVTVRTRDNDIGSPLGGEGAGGRRQEAGGREQDGNRSGFLHPAPCILLPIVVSAPAQSPRAPARSSICRHGADRPGSRF